MTKDYITDNAAAPATQSGGATPCGKVPVRMTNDYLFRALMQQNPNVLKALVGSLLQIRIAEIKSVTILNPIELGKTIDEKDYILDLKIELNGCAVINLEMQVVNEGNWRERSLCYLCRAFDNLNRGEQYEDVRPAVQIGLLDFTLFPEEPEFYAAYSFMNEKTHRIYSSKIRLYVLDLTQIRLATEEDIACKRDRWASFFKAATWEELRMLAKSDPYMEEAVAAVRRLTDEEKIRQQCEAREDYYRRTAGREALLRRTLAEKEKAEQALARETAEKERLRRLLREHGIDSEADA